MRPTILLAALAAAALGARAAGIPPSPVAHTGDISACAGYKLTTVSVTDAGVDGRLELRGACGAYGPDYPVLNLTVRHAADRVRVHIADAEGRAHTVPDDVAGHGGAWPALSSPGVASHDSHLRFDYTEDPFAFKVSRRADGVVLFDTAGSALVFAEQYLRVKSRLAPGSHIQGLGQHTDNFTLPIAELNYTRTLWNRDAPGLPARTNLYGSHPFYVNQHVGESPSASGTFLLNSHGMDITFPDAGASIEYQALGGIADFWFFNGPTPGAVAQQASDVFGRAKEVPYWALGYHSCRYGYEDIAQVAEVVANYSAAGIPLQTQWLDIDYMHNRWIMTLDADRFALDKVRYFVDKLKENGQNFIVMVDPALYSGTPDEPADAYETFNHGLAKDAFLRLPSGELYEPVVWPGPCVLPDFTKPAAREFWTDEIARFFDPATGLDVDGIWLIEANIYRYAKEFGAPPGRKRPRVVPRSIPGFEAFTAGKNISEPFSDTSPAPRSALDDRQLPLVRRLDNATNTQTDYLSPELDSPWLYPPYMLNDRRVAPNGQNYYSGRKNISDRTARTDVVQSNGARIYAEHNLYGSRHALATRDALLARRPGKRPFTVARASFAGTPSALWLGDNRSTWRQYAETIRQLLQFAAVGGVATVGADVCGFGGHTTETLCARWAWLGAFNTFMRNHVDIGGRPQEFYLWPRVADAARAAVRTRLALLDYTYTAIHRHAHDGVPALWPLSWVHPGEAETVHIDTQFYYGPHLLVSPVINENATDVDIYVPDAPYYDFFTLKMIEPRKTRTTLSGVGYDTMPLYVRGGAVLPLRDGRANTTAQNAQLPFRLVVAPGDDGTAKGELYLDDGESLDVGEAFSEITFEYDGHKLTVGGTFGFHSPADIQTVVVAGGAKGNNGQGNGSGHGNGNGSGKRDGNGNGNGQGNGNGNGKGNGNGNGSGNGKGNGNGNGHGNGTNKGVFDPATGTTTYSGLSISLNEASNNPLN